jgi:hypothetical protein
MRNNSDNITLSLWQFYVIALPALSIDQKAFNMPRPIAIILSLNNPILFKNLL